MSSPLLAVDELEKYYEQPQSFLDSLLGDGKPPIQAVDGVSFTLEENDSLAVIGESGCGKSTLLRTLIGLHDPTGGEIRYRGTATSSFDKGAWKDYRSSVQMIFQDPFKSLDPRLTVGETLREPLRIHDMGDRDARVMDILEQVELLPPENYVDSYPKELSGGEKQRVSIARALIVEPDILLADEPVSMLDVSTQASILNMLNDIISNLGVAMVYISHDISTIAYVCQEVHVMYLGRVIESAQTEDLLADPKHPYTQALMSAVPVPDPHNDRARTDIAGSPQDPVGLDSGCRFRDRCPDRMDVCEQFPYEIDVDDHTVACHLYDESTGEGHSGPTSEVAEE
jgi:peptide/nickel transport system ATP-binding protein